VKRSEFEALRDLTGKKIEADIRFAHPRNLSPVWVAENVSIATAGGEALSLHISYNPIVGSKTFNVVKPGVGPICRLDVDGPAHRPAGRSHKHSLQTTRCPDRNLPDGVLDKPEYAGRSIEDLFRIFCQLAHIEFTGTFMAPDAPIVGAT
jgi:hypothetical protein